jgi:hypothetical protein
VPDKTDESRVADLRTQAEVARQAGDWEEFSRLADQADELESLTPLDPRTTLNDMFKGTINPPASFRDALGAFFDDGVADQIEAMAAQLELAADEAGAKLYDARERLAELIAKDGPNSPRVKLAQREIPELEAAYEAAKAEHVQAGRAAVQTEAHLAAAGRAILQERQPKLVEAGDQLRAARATAERIRQTPSASAEDRFAAEQAALDAEKNYREVKAWAEKPPSHAEKRERLQAQLDAFETKQAEMAEALRRGTEPGASEEDLAAMYEAASARASMSG